MFLRALPLVTAKGKVRSFYRTHFACVQTAVEGWRGLRVERGRATMGRRMDSWDWNVWKWRWQATHTRAHSAVATAGGTHGGRPKMGGNSRRRHGQRPLYTFIGVAPQAIAMEGSHPGYNSRHGFEWEWGEGSPYGQLICGGGMPHTRARLALPPPRGAMGSGQRMGLRGKIWRQSAAFTCHGPVASPSLPMSGKHGLEEGMGRQMAASKFIACALL